MVDGRWRPLHCASVGSPSPSSLLPPHSPPVDCLYCFALLCSPLLAAFAFPTAFDFHNFFKLLSFGLACVPDHDYLYTILPAIKVSFGP